MVVVPTTPSAATANTIKLATTATNPTELLLHLHIIITTATTHKPAGPLNRALWPESEGEPPFIAGVVVAIVAIVVVATTTAAVVVVVGNASGPIVVVVVVVVSVYKGVMLKLNRR